MARRKRILTKGEKIAKGRKVADYIAKHNFTDTTDAQFKRKILALMVQNEKTRQGVKTDKRTIFERKLSDFNIRDAQREIARLKNTEAYTSAAERSRNNMKQMMKERFSDSWEEFNSLRQKRDERGRYIKINNQMHWNTEMGGYTFIDEEGHTRFIDVSNSPEEIKFTDLGVL